MPLLYLVLYDIENDNEGLSKVRDGMKPSMCYDTLKSTLS